MGIDAGLVLAAPGAHQHRVEPAGHQAGEHALVLRLRNRLVLQEHVVVFDGHPVEVEVTGSVTPVHLQVVVTGGVSRCRVLHFGRF